MCLNQETVQKFEALPLSATTVKRRIIIKISNYLKSETVRKLLQSPTFAMQLDESTDVENLAELFIYVHCVYNIEENMRFCNPLETIQLLDWTFLTWSTHILLKIVYIGKNVTQYMH
jgi:hypothetical protein